jgi:hypothetical protein
MWKHQNIMNSPFSVPNNLDPEAGFTQVPSDSTSPSISQAANDLRAAAGEKAREFVHTAETKATAIKEPRKELTTSRKPPQNNGRIHG